MAGVPISPKDAALLRQTVGAIQKARGTGVVNGPGSISIGPPRIPAAPPVYAPEPYRLAYISNLSTDANDQWSTSANQWAIYEVTTCYVSAATGDLKPYDENDPRYYKGPAINMAELRGGFMGLTAGKDIVTVTGQTGFVPVATPVQLYWQFDDNGNPVFYFYQYVGPRYAITGSPTNINPYIRWSYPLTLGYWDGSSDASNGGTWTASNPYFSSYDGDSFSGEITHVGFNSAEDMNTGSSGSVTTGTGVSVDTSDGSVSPGGACTYLALPEGDYVVIVPRYFDGTTMYWTISNFANSAQ